MISDVAPSNCNATWIFLCYFCPCFEPVCLLSQDCPLRSLYAIFPLHCAKSRKEYQFCACIIGVQTAFFNAHLTSAQDSGLSEEWILFGVTMSWFKNYTSMTIVLVPGTVVSTRCLVSVGIYSANKQNNKWFFNTSSKILDIFSSFLVMQRGVGLIPRYHVKENCTAILQESQWYVYLWKPCKKGKRTSEIVVGCTYNVLYERLVQNIRLLGRAHKPTTGYNHHGERQHGSSWLWLLVGSTLFCIAPSLLWFLIGNKHNNNNNNNNDGKGTQRWQQQCG